MAAAPVLPTPPAPDTTAAPLSEGARIVDTFIAPSKTFTDLRGAKWWSWVVPLLLIAVSSSLFAFAVGQKVGFDKAGENVLQTRPKQWDRIQGLKPEDRNKAMRALTQQTMIGAYAFPVIDLVLLLIVAGVLLGTFKFAANASVSFKVVLAIVTYASLPIVIKYLLATLALFAGMSPDGFNVQNPVATNLAVLFNSADNPILYAAGSMIDVFAIWTLALTAIGFTCISKVKKATAFAIVFGWYIAFMVVIIGLTSLAV